MTTLRLWPRPATLVALRDRVPTRANLAFVTVSVAILGAAAGLRTAYPDDIEYKADEGWTYAVTESVRAGESWPAFGMPTSQNAPNPGLSIWVFIVLAKVFQTTTPQEMAAVVQWSNVVAIGMVLLFARLCVARSEREPWLWGAAIAAVNPLAVQLHRKIWPPCVTPVLLVPVLAGWWHRDRRWGAAMWGFGVMVVAQIHLAGLFLAAGLAAWALAFDRRRTRWVAWAVGSAAGAWPLVPWALGSFGTAVDKPTGQIRWDNIFTARFWGMWVSEPYGISLHHALGDDFADYLTGPVVSGTPTYLIGAAHGAVIGLMLGAYGFALAGMWRHRRTAGEWLTGRESPTAFAISGMMLGFGAVMTLTCLPVHRQYMILTFPLMYVWVAMLAIGFGGRFGPPVNWGRAALAGLVVAQAGISAGFLQYIHDHPRMIRGDYGMPFRAIPEGGVSLKGKI